MPFTELCITSNFSFLAGGSHPEEYARRAAELGMAAFAVADRNSVSGIVRAHSELRAIAREVAEAQARSRGEVTGPSTLAHALPPDTVVPRLIPAARVCLSGGLEATALPADRAGWGNLCKLLTRGRRRAPKGECELHLADLLELGGNICWLIHPPQGTTLRGGARAWLRQARRLTRRFADCHLAAAPRYDGLDAGRFDRLARVAAGLGIPLVATAAPLKIPTTPRHQGSAPWRHPVIPATTQTNMYG
ncbi:MAG: hypothetical protein ACE5FS_12705 [Paracoccaceae bacterium]